MVLAAGLRVVSVGGIVVEEEAQALHPVLTQLVEDFSLVGVFGFFEETPPLGPGFLRRAQHSPLAGCGMAGFAVVLEDFFTDLDVDRGHGRAQGERKKQEGEEEEAEETGHFRAPFAKNEKHRQAMTFVLAKIVPRIFSLYRVRRLPTRCPSKRAAVSPGGGVPAIVGTETSAKMLKECRDFAEVNSDCFLSANFSFRNVQPGGEEGDRKALST